MNTIELNEVIKTSPESVIRDAWYRAKVEEKLMEATNQLIEDYNIAYPTNEDGSTAFALYSMVTEEFVYDDNDLITEEVIKKYTYLKEYTRVPMPVDMMNPTEEELNAVEELDPAIAELIEEGKIAPTLELYLELKYEDIRNESISDIEYLTYVKPVLINRMAEMVDTHTQDLKNAISGRLLSGLQEERYKTKYNLAVKAKETGNYEIFQEEADLQEVTTEILVDLIIEMGERWNDALNIVSNKLEVYRIYATKLINEVVTVDELSKLDALFSLVSSVTLESNIKELIDNTLEG